MPKPLPGTRRWDRKALDQALDALSGIAPAAAAEDPFEEWERKYNARNAEEEWERKYDERNAEDEWKKCYAARKAAEGKRRK